MVHVRIQYLTPGQEFEVILGGVVIARHRLVAAGAHVTLPEHKDAIKAAARAASRPQQPRRAFRQLQADSEQFTYAAAPVVQTRSLAEYERLLESA
mgnify:CR=1 FL=1